MARSLTVKHDEAPRTSALFTSFLVLSVGFLLAGAFVVASADASADLDPGPSLRAEPPIGR